MVTMETPSYTINLAEQTQFLMTAKIIGLLLLFVRLVHNTKLIQYFLLERETLPSVGQDGQNPRILGRLEHFQDRTLPRRPFNWDRSKETWTDGKPTLEKLQSLALLHS